MPREAQKLLDEAASRACHTVTIVVGSVLGLSYCLIIGFVSQVYKRKSNSQQTHYLLVLASVYVVTFCLPSLSGVAIVSPRLAIRAACRTEVQFWYKSLPILFPLLRSLRASSSRLGYLCEIAERIWFLISVSRCTLTEC